jgi:DNA polymerase V
MYINEVTEKNGNSSAVKQKKNENEKADLNDFLRIKSDSSFIMKVRGDSMLNAGISSGDMLIADKSIKPKSGDIVIAELNGKLTVKRLFDNGKRILLRPENKKYKSIQVANTDNMFIWGVVTQNIRSV